METCLVLLGGRRTAKPDEIAYLKGDLNYTQIFFNDGTFFLSSTTLKILENRLSPHGFFRTHKSSLVNLKLLKGMGLENKETIIALTNDQFIEVSRRKRIILRKILIKNI